MSAADTLRQAAEDMGTVLDVVDAMHADAPEYAATLIEQMGIDRTCLAALRVIDVVVHLIAAERADGSPVVIGDVTEYIRQSIVGGSDVAHPV